MSNQRWIERLEPLVREGVLDGADPEALKGMVKAVCDELERANTIGHRAMDDLVAQRREIDRLEAASRHRADGLDAVLSRAERSLREAQDVLSAARSLTRKEEIDPEGSPPLFAQQKEGSA